MTVHQIKTQRVRELRNLRNAFFIWALMGLAIVACGTSGTGGGSYSNSSDVETPRTSGANRFLPEAE